MKKCGYLYQQYSLPWQTGFCSSSLNQKEKTICIFATYILQFDRNSLNFKIGKYCSNGEKLNVRGFATIPGDQCYRQITNKYALFTFVFVFTISL